MRLQVIRTRPGGWHKELKQGISQVSGTSEVIYLHRFWNLDWRKHRREKTQMEDSQRDVYSFHGMLSVSPAPHSHIVLLFWSPLGHPLSSGHLSPLWESVSRSNILSVALSHIACLVMTLFPDSTLVLLGLLGALDFSSCAHHSWDEPPCVSKPGFHIYSQHVLFSDPCPPSAVLTSWACCLLRVHGHEEGGNKDYSKV